MVFDPRLDDIRFALESAAELWRVTEGGAFPDLDPELLVAVLEGGAALARDTLAPLNRVGDREGLRLEGDRVITAPGFKEAYEAFMEGGWQGLSASPDHGGQGLPRALALAVAEMMHGANMSFGLAPMLTLGAIEALEAHGSAAQRALYLPRLVAGTWTGAMNLTEPQAGSDVGALTTRAEPQSDGTFRITGQKIYITFGEHDFTENIVHLVLARIVGAPAGSKGVSLFLAPKFLPKADGTPGERNALRCIGLEHKLGIHASPTCTMAFEGASAWLVGEENKGLAAMFTMMNSARLNVGVQGVAVGEAAYQKALAYAKERRQGRADGATGAGPSPIVEHPDVRRMLLTMRARVLAARAICFATGIAADLAERAPTAEDRAAAKAREDLLTPLAKAWSTDGGVEAASLGVQVHGGMGFIEDGGAAQFYRDARILPIYEGTNGIQANDLYARKLLGDQGAAVRALIDEANQAGVSASGDMRRSGERLQSAAQALSRATDALLAAERRDGLAGATAYLDLTARVAAGMLLIGGVARAPEAKEQAAVVRYFAESYLVGTAVLADIVQHGGSLLYDEDLASLAS